MANGNDNLLDTWMNKEFFEKILRKDENDDEILVKQLTSKAAIAKGENYSSQLIRTKIIYIAGSKEEKSRSLIIKAGLGGVPRKPFIGENNEDKMFTKEVAVCRDILPLVHKLLQDTGDLSILAPKCFGATSISPAYIIFEDLSEKGYANLNRRKGLSMDHFKLILTKLAKWHAATAVIGNTQDPRMAIFKQSLSEEEVTYYLPLFTNSILACADEVKTWSGYEKIANKLYKIVDTIETKLANPFQPTRFNVVLHGDLWMNNIMFTTDAEEKPLNAIIIDYAMGCWTSPGYDLAYIFYTSSDENVREQEWDLLIEYYYEELCNNLVQMKYSHEFITIDEMKAEIIKESLVAAIISTFLVGIRHLEDTENAALSTIMGDAEENILFRKKLVSSKNYRRTMEYLLDFYDRKGILD